MEEFKKTSKELSHISILKILGQATRKFLVDNNIVILDRTNTENRNKYMRRNPIQKLYFTEGYDLMQYMIVVKPYIKKKFNIKKDSVLEILLYLFPFQYFLKSDFKMLASNTFHISLESLIEDGFVEMRVKSAKTNQELYSLSDHGMKIVKEYYQYLSGEKTLNPGSYTNPFRSKKKVKIDMVRERVMMRLKAQTENKPELFRKKLY